MELVPVLALALACRAVEVCGEARRVLGGEVWGNSNAWTSAGDEESGIEEYEAWI